MDDLVAHFRFYEELNDFLPPQKRKNPFPYTFKGVPSVKDAIEAIGVPHTEVDLILVNGRSVAFDYCLCQGDRVSVYPVFESLDISPVIRLRAAPLRRTAFVCDTQLGRLARLLRMMGFDTLNRNDYDDPEIVRISLKDKRIILTRDIGILKQKVVTHGYWIRSTSPDEQLEEVLRRCDLFGQIRPFRRCLVCNGIVERVDKETILHRLEPRTKRYYDEFYRCPDCGRIYWKGSHYQRMLAKMEKYLGGVREDH